MCRNRNNMVRHVHKFHSGKKPPQEGVSYETLRKGLWQCQVCHKTLDREYFSIYRHLKRHRLPDFGGLLPDTPLGKILDDEGVDDDNEPVDQVR